MATPPRLISTLPADHAICVAHFSPCDRPMHAGDVVHDHSGIALYLSGVTQMYMGMHYRLRRGDIFLVPEGMPHCASAESNGKALGMALCTGCMRGDWGAYLQELFHGVRCGDIALRHLDEESAAHLQRLLESLAEELANPQCQHVFMVDGLMLQIVALIARAAPGKSENTPVSGCPPIVAQALDYIERHAHQSISLTDVAKAVGRSSAHLASLMKESTGRTVVAWITHGRMAMARQLLMGSDDAIDVIAEAVGFASPSHFHRIFKRMHQVSPGQWRLMHRK